MTKILDVSPTADNTTTKPGQSVTGRMLTLACSQDGQVVYSGSFANLWVSQDGGGTWGQVTSPQPPPSQFGVPGALGGWQVMDVAVSPADSQTVLVITAHDRGLSDRGIWRTTEGGNTWAKAHQFPSREAVGQLAWAPQDNQLVFAAGGSALAISRNGGVTFNNVLSLGPGRGFQPVTHVAVAPSPPSVPTPPAVYALGRNGLMFVSLDGGLNWIQDQGNVPRDSGGAVGTANSQAPSVLVVSPRSPREVFLVGNANLQAPVLRRGDYSQFSKTHPQSNWEPLTLPNLGDQDSGNVFIQTTQPGRGDLLFYGAQRNNVWVGPLDPASASDWVELDPQKKVHVDLHGIFLSPNFDATIQDGRLQVSAGTIWLLSDGGIYASVFGGDFQPVKYVNSLSCLNVAGVAMEGVGPALSLNTGDNDGFYSLNGSRNWAPQEYGGGDNDCSFADPLAPNLMLVFTPRWDGTVTLYKNEQGGLPDATKNSPHRHIVPGPPRTTDLFGSTMRAWNAVSDFALRGSRPIVLTKPGEAPAGDGDYVFIRFKTDQKAVVLRTQSLLDIESPDDWDLLTEPSTTSAQMQIGNNFTDSTPFVTSDGWVYFQGTDNRLLKVFNDGSGGTQIGTNSTDSAPFVTEDGWVYFRGHQDNTLWKVFRDGSGLMPIGNNFTASTPFVTSDGWVYFQGTDNRLLKVFNDGSGGTQIGTNSTDSAPFVTDDGWVYFRGHHDNLLWRVFKDGSHLMSLGGNTTNSTPFVTPGGWVYFQGTDNRLLKLFIPTSQRRVYQQGPVLPSVDLGVLQTSGGHTGTVFYVGGNAQQELWKWTEGMPNWERLVPLPRTGVTAAKRFFVDPYRPNLIYLLDQTHVRRSEDGGNTWHVDFGLEQQLTCNLLIPIGRPEVDLGDVVLQDMQFDPHLSLTRFAVGIGGAFFTNDGANWNRLLDTAAQPGRPTSCYYDWVSNPCERSLYVALSGRSVVKIGPLPWGALQAPDPALWSPSVMVSGLQSKSTPAVALFQGSMHMVRNDPQNNALVWTTSPDGLNWSPDQPLGPSSQTGASLAAFESVLHMVYLENGSHLIRWWTFDGSTWTDQGYIPDLSIQPPQPPQNLSSSTLPALVSFENLVMVFTDPSSNEIYMVMYDGATWRVKISIKGQFSTRPVKLAVYNGAIHMVYLADTDHVCWSVYIGSVLQNGGGGAWWSRTRIRCRKSQSAPALAAHNGLLHMVHRGDGSNSIWWSLFDGDEWTPSVEILGQASQTTAALCEIPNQSRLVVLHLRDASNEIWFSAV